jgi:S1-C subfamily serine protease
MNRNLLVATLIAPLLVACASQMVEHQAQDRCAKKGRSAFLTEIQHSGVPLLIDSASANVLCFRAEDVTHLPPAFGADAISIGDPDGAGIVTVMTGSVADKAGLKVYDIVFEADGRAIKVAADLGAALDGAAPGSQLKLKVRRRSKDLSLIAKY